MPNTKTGTTWAPDIRPENIETVTETFAPENGAEQTATYKVVDNHPILNKILDKMAFFRTHVSAIWYNKLANITLKQKLDAIDAGVEEVSAKMENTIKQIPKQISSPPSEHNSFVFLVSRSFDIANISIPVFSRGIFISGGSDASLIAHDVANNKLILASRISGVWSKARIL